MPRAWWTSTSPILRRLTWMGSPLEDGTLTIEAAGVYSLTGSYSGQIVVDTKGKVYLELNGMAVTSDSGPALWIKDASKVTLVLTDGTANSLADTDTGDSDGAALSSNDSLYVTGTGSLTVIGANSDAISCDDDIVINNGLIAITAAGDGLAANDDITINGGDISVTAKGDGLDSNGTVHVNGGSLVAFGGTSQGEGGIDARGDFVITGGTVIAGGNLVGGARRRLAADLRVRHFLGGPSGRHHRQPRPGWRRSLQLHPGCGLSEPADQLRRPGERRDLPGLSGRQGRHPGAGFEVTAMSRTTLLDSAARGLRRRRLPACLPTSTSR